ncbi:MAG: hypothetical protein IT370_12630 [Deltaproteobacteria bacterium]|nr:hypothetical protein [Deltaproteobacteria bacterium]
MSRRLAPKLALTSLLALASCYSPSLVDGFDCDPSGNQPLCPSGFTCNLADQKCYSSLPGPGDDGGTIRDAATPDGTVVPAAPIMLGRGDRVAMARTTAGARIAWQEPAQTGGTGTAIRWVDVDNSGSHTAPQAFVQGGAARSGLVGAGSMVPFFGWLTKDASSTQLTVTTAGSVLNLSALADDAPWAIASASTNGYAAYVRPDPNDPAKRAITLARWTGANVTRVDLESFSTRISALDLVAAEDSTGLLVAFVEVDDLLGTITTERLHVRRVRTSDLKQDWEATVDTDSQGGPISVDGMLRHPRLALSGRGGLVLVGYEKRLRVGAAALQYSNGDRVGSTTYLEATATQPAPLALPVAGGSAGATPSALILGIGAVLRGPLLRAGVVPAMSVVSQGANLTSPFALGDELGNVYVMMQEGGDSGGDVKAFAMQAGWPATGLSLNSAANRGGTDHASVRRGGGGVIAAWLENVRLASEVWYQVVAADASKLAK